MVARVAAPEAVVAVTNSPDLFWSAANGSLLCVAYPYSTYPMAPGVCLIRAVTPSLPFPATPIGQVTLVPSPTWSLNSGLIALRCFVKTKVVPLPSERSQTVIAVAGSFAPSFALAIAASFHLVILPRKMPT